MVIWIFCNSTVMAIMDGVAILAPRPCLGAWRIEACGPQYQRRHPFERAPRFVPAFRPRTASPTGAAGYGTMAATGWAQRPCDEAMMRPPPHTAAVGLNGASCLIRPPPHATYSRWAVLISKLGTAVLKNFGSPDRTALRSAYVLGPARAPAGRGPLAGSLLTGRSVIDS